MSKLPCIDCLTLSICRSLVDERLQRLNTHRLSYNVINCSEIITFMDVHIIVPLVNKCSLINSFLSEENQYFIGFNRKHLFNLLSYLNKEAARLYKETDMERESKYGRNPDRLYDYKRYRNKKK